MNQLWETNLTSGVSHDGHVYKFAAVTPSGLPTGFKPIAERTRRAEANLERKQGLAEARAWLAHTPAIQPKSLKQLRLAKGMSQQHLADLVGTTQAQIARLESGTVDPQVSTICRLAEAIGIESTTVFVMFKHE